MKKSIKRLPKCTQEELTVLLDLVCKSIGNCQMVILFGSYARGNYVLWDTNIEFGVHTSYQSDYDILLVVTGQTKYVERKLNRITNKYHDLFADRRHAFPQFVVEHINTVNRNLEISQYFFTDIVKEGIMLYNSGKCELAKPRKLSFREIRILRKNSCILFHATLTYNSNKFTNDFEIITIFFCDNYRTIMRAFGYEGYFRMSPFI